MQENAKMTVVEMREIVELAEQTSEAAELAGASSRSRFVDVQLTAVRDKAAALAQRVQRLAEEQEG